MKCIPRGSDVGNGRGVRRFIYYYYYLRRGTSTVDSNRVFTPQPLQPLARRTGGGGKAFIAVKYRNYRNLGHVVVLRQSSNGIWSKRLLAPSGTVMTMPSSALLRTIWHPNRDVSVWKDTVHPEGRGAGGRETKKRVGRGHSSQSELSFFVVFLQSGFW